MARATRARMTAGGIVCTLAALVAGCGGSGDASREVVDPQIAVLHAGDLPRGYREGDDTVCSIPSATEGNWPQLERLFWETQPHGCLIELDRIWTPTPGQAGFVTSAAFVFRSDEDAQRAYRAQVELVRFTAGLEARRSEDAELGDQAQLLFAPELDYPGVAVVWRRGNVVAVLAVYEGDASAALALAQQQDELIRGDAEPAPPPTAADAMELPLDDPALEYPVYWLGRTFAPGRGLPAIELGEVYATPRGAELGYGSVDPGHRGGVRLELSRPAVWKRGWGRTRLGRLIWDSPCARKTVVELPGGHAEIYEGYGVSRVLMEPCPTSEPDRVVAHVYLGGTLIRINMPWCYSCGVASSGNPYDTVAAMTAVARGLKVRRS